MEDQNCIINYFSKYSSDKEILNNCFIFDVFSRKNYLKFWILKENTDFHFDGNNKAYFQHIMPFWIGDEIEINVSLFNNKGYLEIGVINQMYLEEGIRQINSFRWKSLYFKKIPNLQIFDTNDSYKIKNNTLYSYNTEMQDYDLSRICELELLKNIWFDLILRDKK